MAVRSDFSDDACSIARGVDVLGDPWVVLILRELFQGVVRFDAIVAATGAAESVVSRRLGVLVEAGLVVKVPYESGARPRVEYRLTDSGRDTLPVLHALSRWAAAHSADRTHVTIECLRCGTEPPSADWCPTCAAPLTAASTGWRKAARPGSLLRLAAD